MIENFLIIIKEKTQYYIYIKKYILYKNVIICDYLSWDLRYHQDFTLEKYSVYKLAWNM